MLLPLVRRVNSHWVALTATPGAEQQTDVALGAGPPRCFEQTRRAGRAPRKRLSRVEQERQKSGAKTGA